MTNLCDMSTPADRNDPNPKYRHPGKHLCWKLMGHKGKHGCHCGKEW